MGVQSPLVGEKECVPISEESRIFGVATKWCGYLGGLSNPWYLFRDLFIPSPSLNPNPDYVKVQKTCHGHSDHEVRASQSYSNI